MKVILSRKGFDSQYGGQPSPILPDGTLLSLPIPIPEISPKYSDLIYNDKSYFEIIQELKPNKQITIDKTCHLDPDIRKDILSKRDKDWKAIFGQSEAAQGHLAKNNISKEDIFLFFGWFKQTELINGKFCYKLDSSDLHIIYGYLQVGEIYKYGDKFPPYCLNHPHANINYSAIKSNCLYVANEQLTLNEKLKGANILRFNSNLILTKEGMSRSRWKLPEFFKDLTITYHSKNSFKDDYFQSAAKGQEFIIEANNNLLEWIKNIIENN